MEKRVVNAIIISLFNTAIAKLPCTFCRLLEYSIHYLHLLQVKAGLFMYSTHT